MSFLGRMRLFFFFITAMLLPCTSFAAVNGDSNLPDAPQPTAAASAAAQPAAFQASSSRPASAPLTPAPRLAKYIGTDQSTVPLSAKEKLELSGWEQVQPYAFATQFMGAGWEQLINSNPQYGTDSGAFGERLGAAALLQNSRAILSDGIMAAMFRQDPRYYRQGHRPVKQRIYHAIERVFVIRSDDRKLPAELFAAAGQCCRNRVDHDLLSRRQRDLAEDGKGLWHLPGTRCIGK